MTVPFAKVDKESRTVSGFATLDNVDRQGDIVDTEASVAAFKAFRGNIREMHQPIAAGRLLSFSEKEYYDHETQKVYTGVYVTAYISKGAQDTWEKVLDGTLSGFSIGGNITDATPVFDKVADKTIRVIKAYDLVELSLVDSPANQLANIFAVVKSDDGSLSYKGMAVETETETVFWCPSDQIAQLSKDDERTCDVCDGKMQSIGWIESSDVNKSDVIKQVVDNYLSAPEVSKQADTENSEGGIDVDVEKAADVVEETVSEEVVEEAVEKAAEVSEVEAEVEAPAVDLEKKFEEIKEFISDGLEKNRAYSTEQIEELRSAIQTVSDSMEKRLTEVEESNESINKAVETLRETLGGIQKAVSALDKSFAMKKSEELGGSSAVTTKKSDDFWSGHFLSVSEL